MPATGNSASKARGDQKGLDQWMRRGDWVCEFCHDIQFRRNMLCRCCGGPSPFYMYCHGGQPGGHALAHPALPAGALPAGHPAAGDAAYPGSYVAPYPAVSPAAGHAGEYATAQAAQGALYAQLYNQYLHWYSTYETGTWEDPALAAAAAAYHNAAAPPPTVVPEKGAPTTSANPKAPPPGLSAPTPKAKKVTNNFLGMGSSKTPTAAPAHGFNAAAPTFIPMTEIPAMMSAVSDPMVYAKSVVPVLSSENTTLTTTPNKTTEVQDPCTEGTAQHLWGTGPETPALKTPLKNPVKRLNASAPNFIPVLGKGWEKHALDGLLSTE